MNRRSRPAAAALSLAVAIVALGGCAAAVPVQSSGDPVGTWGTVADRSAYLVIEPDGKMLGNDSCNGFSGAWEQAEPSAPIVFHDTVMSLMMCEGTNAWLTSGRSAIVDGDVIYVLDDEGEVLGTLPRE